MISNMISPAVLSQDLCQLYLPYGEFFAHEHYSGDTYIICLSE